MKKKFLSIIALVLCLIMTASTVSASAGTKQKTANSYFTTTINSSGDVVTVTVSVAKKSKITNARVAVLYDPEVMTLKTSLCPSLLLGLTSVNSDYSAKGKAGVSVAWVTMAPTCLATTALSLSFKVKNAQNKQKVSVETQVLEAYQGDVRLDLDESTTSTTTLSIKKSIFDLLPIGPIFGGKFGWF